MPIVAFDSLIEEKPLSLTVPQLVRVAFVLLFMVPHRLSRVPPELTVIAP